MLGRYGMNSFHSGQGRAVDSCQHSNEPLGSIRFMDFLNYLSEHQFLTKNSDSLRWLIVHAQYFLLLSVVQREICLRSQFHFKPLDYQVSEITQSINLTDYRRYSLSLSILRFAAHLTKAKAANLISFGELPDHVHFTNFPIPCIIPEVIFSYMPESIG